MYCCTVCLRVQRRIQRSNVAGSTSPSQPLTRQERQKGWHNGLCHLLCARINPPHKWTRGKQVKNCVMDHLGETMLTKLFMSFFFFLAQRKRTTIFPCKGSVSPELNRGSSKNFQGFNILRGVYLLLRVKQEGPTEV